ncbi:unnamed protein product [Pseudo-nitzschia multistriata]|uniref:Uncharacterized protein n=1 Tax=Pseudo-nitzschia multistriata TaxID=183589 RepID=A0A448ZPL3_9STRA|nr:unnamed protein product [Pseudo-nitzschia multistriata]
MNTTMSLKKDGDDVDKRDKSEPYPTNAIVLFNKDKTFNKHNNENTIEDTRKKIAVDTDNNIDIDKKNHNYNHNSINMSRNRKRIDDKNIRNHKNIPYESECEHNHTKEQGISRWGEFFDTDRASEAVQYYSTTATAMILTTTTTTVTSTKVLKVVRAKEPEQQQYLSIHQFLFNSKIFSFASSRPSIFEKHNLGTSCSEYTSVTMAISQSSSFSLFIDGDDGQKISTLSCSNKNLLAVDRKGDKCIIFAKEDRSMPLPRILKSSGSLESNNCATMVPTSNSTVSTCPSVIYNWKNKFDCDSGSFDDRVDACDNQVDTQKKSDNICSSEEHQIEVIELSQEESRKDFSSCTNESDGNFPEGDQEIIPPSSWSCSAAMMFANNNDYEDNTKSREKSDVEEKKFVPSEVFDDDESGMSWFINTFPNYNESNSAIILHSETAIKHPKTTVALTIEGGLDPSSSLLPSSSVDLSSKKGRNCNVYGGLESLASELSNLMFSIEEEQEVVFSNEDEKDDKVKGEVKMQSRALEQEYCREESIQQLFETLEEKEAEVDEALESIIMETLEIEGQDNRVIDNEKYDSQQENDLVEIASAIQKYSQEDGMDDDMDNKNELLSKVTESFIALPQMLCITPREQQHIIHNDDVLNGVNTNKEDEETVDHQTNAVDEKDPHRKFFADEFPRANIEVLAGSSHSNSYSNELLGKMANTFRSLPQMMGLTQRAQSQGVDDISITCSNGINKSKKCSSEISSDVGNRITTIIEPDCVSSSTSNHPNIEVKLQTDINGSDGRDNIVVVDEVARMLRKNKKKKKEKNLKSKHCCSDAMDVLVSLTLMEMEKSSNENFVNEMRAMRVHESPSSDNFFNSASGSIDISRGDPSDSHLVRDSNVDLTATTNDLQELKEHSEIYDEPNTISPPLDSDSFSIDCFPENFSMDEDVSQTTTPSDTNKTNPEGGKPIVIVVPLQREGNSDKACNEISSAVSGSFEFLKSLSSEERIPSPPQFKLPFNNPNASSADTKLDEIHSTDDLGTSFALPLSYALNTIDMPSQKNLPSRNQFTSLFTRDLSVSPQKLVHTTLSLSLSLSLSDDCCPIPPSPKHSTKASKEPSFDDALPSNMDSHKSEGETEGSIVVSISESLQAESMKNPSSLSPKKMIATTTKAPKGLLKTINTEGLDKERRQKVFPHLAMNKILFNATKKKNKGLGNNTKKHIDIGDIAEDSLRIRRSCYPLFSPSQALTRDDLSASTGKILGNDTEEQQNHVYPCTKDQNREVPMGVSPKSILKASSQGDGTSFSALEESTGITPESQSSKRRVHWNETQLADKIEKGVMFQNHRNGRPKRPAYALQQLMCEIADIQDGYGSDMEQLWGYQQKPQGYIC